MAAVLAAGEGVVAGGLAAAWVWGAADVAPGALELLSFNSRLVRLDRVLVRRTSLEPAGLVTIRHGIPVVTAPLAIAQISRARPELAIKVARDLVKKGRTTWPALHECLTGPAGRTSDRRLRRYVERAMRVSGHDDSPSANDLGAALLDAGVPQFVTQLLVPTQEGDFVLDFAWREFKVGLEYQGWEDHGMIAPDLERDARRRNILTSLGWTILDARSGLSHADIIRWVLATLATRAREFSNRGAHPDY
jgi:very-short-patch-repair endonuclease